MRTAEERSCCGESFARQDRFTLTSESGTYYKVAFLQNPQSEASCWTRMADKDDVLLNSREVAFLLDLSPDTVNEFARRNIIPAFKKGRQWRFRKRDITSVKRQLRGINAAA
jgi:excisionase family DNA binding protein